jgi:hypothetical protein
MTRRQALSLASQRWAREPAPGDGMKGRRFGYAYLGHLKTPARYRVGYHEYVDDGLEAKTVELGRSSASFEDAFAMASEREGA